MLLSVFSMFFFANKSPLIYKEMLMLRCCAPWKHAPLLTTSTGIVCFQRRCFKEKRVLYWEKLFLCISFAIFPYFLQECTCTGFVLFLLCIFLINFVLFFCTAHACPPPPPLLKLICHLFFLSFVFVRYPSPLFDRPGRFMSRCIDVLVLRRLSFQSLFPLGRSV